MDSLNVFSLNTRGTINKLDRIIKEIQSYDIILLQEQIINKKVIETFEKKLNCKVRYTTDTENGRSIVILIKQKYEKYVRDEHEMVKGRLFKININIEGLSLSVLNVYGPAQKKDREHFWNEVISVMGKEKNLIMGGDYNIVLRKEDTDALFKEEKYVKKIKKLWIKTI